jgi:hypothetical protein
MTHERSEMPSMDAEMLVASLLPFVSDDRNGPVLDRLMPFARLHVRQEWASILRIVEVERQLPQGISAEAALACWFAIASVRSSSRDHTENAIRLLLCLYAMRAVPANEHAGLVVEDYVYTVAAHSCLALKDMAPRVPVLTALYLTSLVHFHWHPIVLQFAISLIFIGLATDRLSRFKRIATKEIESIGKPVQVVDLFGAREASEMAASLVLLATSSAEDNEDIVDLISWLKDEMKRARSWPPGIDASDADQAKAVEMWLARYNKATRKPRVDPDHGGVEGAS